MRRWLAGGLLVVMMMMTTLALVGTISANESDSLAILTDFHQAEDLEQAYEALSSDEKLALMRAFQDSPEIVEKEETVRLDTHTSSSTAFSSDECATQR